MQLSTPSRDDPAVAGATELIGGPIGRHASGPWLSWWTPVRVALGLTILFCVFGYLQKSACLTHPYTDEYQYTRLCYTDTYVLYTVEGLNARTDQHGTVTGSVGVPYRDHAVEYPPIIGGLMWTAAELTHVVHGGGADPGGRHATTFFNITALGLATLALISTFSIAQIVGKPRAWDAVMVAASPALLMHAYTNWDLAAVALTCLALFAWSRGSPTWAGVALGLGIATKLYPLLVLVALVMLCARNRQWRAATKAVGATVAAAVVAYLPAIILSSQTPAAVYRSQFVFPRGCDSGHPLRGWEWFSSFSQIRGADWGSIWLVLGHVVGRFGHPTAQGRILGQTAQCGTAPAFLNWVSAGAVLLVVIGVGWLVWKAPWRPRVGQVAFLLVAGFVIFNKIDSPQYVLWLLPLAVLARPRWTSLLIWQVTEVLLGAANLYTLIAQDHAQQGVPMDTYLFLIVIRDVVLAGLMALVVREALNPRLDVVRNDGVDDPAGGVLVTA